MKTTSSIGDRFVQQALRPVSRLFGCLAFLFAGAVFGQPGSAGIVTGSVRNSGTDAFLEGAEVSVIGTSRTALTRRDGTFTLNDLQPGSYRLRVFYTGLDPKEIPVEVRGNQTATVAVDLKSDVYTLDALTVAGEREGTAAALTRQRTALNVVNVVSTDAYGDVFKVSSFWASR